MTSSICNGIVDCMNAAAENKLRVNQLKYQHERDMEIAKFARERENDNSQAKEMFSIVFHACTCSMSHIICGKLNRR